MKPKKNLIEIAQDWFPEENDEHGEDKKLFIHNFGSPSPNTVRSASPCVIFLSSKNDLGRQTSFSRGTLAEKIETKTQEEDNEKSNTKIYSSFYCN